MSAKKHLSELNRIGRPPGSITIADRSLRLKMALACAEHFPLCVDFLAKTVADPKGDFWEKLAASKELMNRAFGKPPQSIEAHFEQQKRQILEVRWLPPDPNDRSRLIEPEPD